MTNYTTNYELPLPAPDDVMTDSVALIAVAMSAIDLLLFQRPVREQTLGCEQDGTANLAGADLNVLRRCGVWRTLTAGVSGLPSGWPQASYAVLVISSPTTAVQVIVNSTALSGAQASRMAVRSMVSDNMWGSWLEIWHSNSLPDQTSPIDTTSSANIRVGGFGLGKGITLTSGANLFSLPLPAPYTPGTSAGFCVSYQWAADQAPANSPSGASIGGFLSRIIFNDTYETLVATLANGRQYKTIKTGGSWGQWREVLDTSAAVQLNLPLVNGSNLNDVMLSGFYTLGTGHTNMPAGADNGQMIVSRGGTTICQTIHAYSGSNVWTRQGNPPNIGGSGAFTAWVLHYHSGNLDSVLSDLEAIALAGL